MNPTQADARSIAVLRVSCVAALAGAAWGGHRVWQRVEPRRVIVEGSSMAPSLQPGDRLLLAHPRRLRNGDVVALRDPRDLTHILVKRVETLTGAGVDVRGDNAGASTDSRTFGLVAREAVIGRAVYRYEPGHRAGALARDRRPTARRRRR